MNVTERIIFSEFVINENEEVDHKIENVDMSLRLYVNVTEKVTFSEYVISSILYLNYIRRDHFFHSIPIDAYTQQQYFLIENYLIITQNLEHHYIYSKL